MPDIVWKCGESGYYIYIYLFYILGMYNTTFSGYSLQYNVGGISDLKNSRHSYGEKVMNVKEISGSIHGRIRWRIFITATPIPDSGIKSNSRCACGRRFLCDKWLTSGRYLCASPALCLVISPGTQPPGFLWPASVQLRLRFFI